MRASRSRVTRADYGDTASVVSLQGEFDLADEGHLRSTFLAAVTVDRPHLIVDLTRTTFVDSIVLGTLVSARKRALDCGGWFRLVGPPPGIRTVLAITGLDTVFGIHRSIAAAAEDGFGTRQGPLRAPADC